jgi:AP-1 complex subunit mu
MNAEFKLPTIESPNRNKYKKNPVSGFQVRYLKIVDKSGYKAFPWVRYLTKNGEYQVRTS